MILPLVRPGDFCRSTHEARQMLWAARRDLDRGELITAGCRLREAVRQHIAALCDQHGCWPARRRDRVPSRQLAALYQAKAIDKCDRTWLAGALEIGNTLAHCGHVRPSLIETAIWLVHLVLDVAAVETNAPDFGRGVRP